jgi:hypothetical protein
MFVRFTSDGSAARQGFEASYTCLEDLREVDAASLLEALAAADRPHNMAHTWNATGHPCDAGWDAWSEGWRGVQCNDGRVVAVGLDDQGWSGGELLPFAQISVLWYLDLRGTAIRGDVADLAPLTFLRTLLLSDTAVHGEIGSLAVLTLLGQVNTLPDGSSDPERGLWVDGTDVHGLVAPLRALPGLGWSTGKLRFERCGDPCNGTAGCRGAVYDGCEAAELSLVDGAAEVAGRDECACCKVRTHDQQRFLVSRGDFVRDPATGVCAVPADWLSDWLDNLLTHWLSVLFVGAAALITLSACVGCTRRPTKQPAQEPAAEFDALVARPKRVRVVTDL